MFVFEYAVLDKLSPPSSPSFNFLISIKVLIFKDTADTYNEAKMQKTSLDIVRERQVGRQTQKMWEADITSATQNSQLIMAKRKASGLHVEWRWYLEEKLRSGSLLSGPLISWNLTDLRPSHLYLLVYFYHCNKRLETVKYMNRNICLILFGKWEGQDKDAIIYFTSNMVPSFCSLEEGSMLYLHMEKGERKKGLCYLAFIVNLT